MAALFRGVLPILLLVLVRSEEPKSCGITIVVLGSTGDLARRYIWPAVFDRFLARLGSHDCSLHTLYAAGRKVVENEEELWRAISANLRCPSEDDSRCSQQKALFRAHTHFIQLESEESYGSMATSIEQNYDLGNRAEVGRLFYLAVPPSAYISIAQKIDQHVRPRSGGGWIRVVVEKPFGHDLKSAKTLSEELLKYLKEEEIYRIDHYLGKLGLQQILPFRETNKNTLRGIWNGHSIQCVEIALKERLGVEGRSQYYDKYGVIRDVIQNHLMEMLVQTAMNVHTSESAGDFLTSKNTFLSKVYPPKLQSTLLGQYSTYHTHLSADGMLYNPGNGSHTPTFAAVAVYLRDADWLGVPFVLLSGKQLGERSAYIRISFKKTLFTPVASLGKCALDIVFLVQSESISEPGVLVAEGLQYLSLLPPYEDWLVRDVMYEGCPYVLMYPRDTVSPNAYASLIESVWKGDKDWFVDVTSLLLSWAVWTPLLSEIDLEAPVMQVYSLDSLDTLSFRLDETRVVPTLPSHTGDGESINVPVTPDLPSSLSLPAPSLKVRVIGSQDSELVTGHFAQVSSRLAGHISQLAVDTVRRNGSFHLALPGGASPLLIFQSLVLEQRHTMPWQETHVWQSDERCVERNSRHSNFLQLSEHLLSLVPIPHTNVHPMPVSLHSGLCIGADRGTELYEEELGHYAHGHMDLTLIGVGMDGHVASVFPSTAVEEEEGKRVRVAQLHRSHPVHVKRRMSLSLDTILESKHIALVIAGEGKEAVFGAVLRCVGARDDEDSVDCQLPVVELVRRVSRGQLTVFCMLPECS